MNNRSTVEHLLQNTGIHINGDKLSDIWVHDDRFYNSILKDGSLGLGESYMEGWWSCDALDDFLYKLLNSELTKSAKRNAHVIWLSLISRVINRQTRSTARKVADIHYNIGNDLFEHMLGKHMMYSCAYWDNASTLDQAQEKKLELICKKLGLYPGLTVLDIGCGWGGFAKYAAEKYQVKVTGITISEEQLKYAKARCKGLSVNFKLQDYRDLNEKYDRIVSIGMFEHVGYKNYSAFMDMVYQNLKNDGIFLLHCIGGNDCNSFTDPWIDRYIFPNGMMPSPVQITMAIQSKFILQDWHNFGIYYDLTLMEWLKRFKESWPLIKGKYGDRFYRMWEYYLSICAASFRAKQNNLWQIVLTKPQYPFLYKSVR